MIQHCKINDKDVYVFPSRTTKDKHIIHWASSDMKYYCSCPKKVWNTEKCRHLKILEYTLKFEPEMIIEIDFEKIRDYL
jgi:hypothetical protein